MTTTKRRQGNPTTSPYYSMKAADRKSPPLSVTLPPEAHEALAEIVEATGETKSGAVAVALIERAKRMKKK